MKVFALTTQWNNGRKFEGGTSVMLFGNLDNAKGYLNHYATQAIEMIENACGSTYEDEDERTDTYRLIADTEDYGDWWEGMIEEKEVY